MGSEELLEGIAAEWRSTRRGYRDGALAVGARLRDYVTLRLAEGDGCSEAERIARRASREHATMDAARALGISVLRVNELIRCAAAAELFSIGGLSYSSVRLLRLLIYRPKQQRTRTKADVLREVWAVRPEYDSAAQLLVAEAAADGWNEAELRAAIGKLTAVPQQTRAPRQQQREMEKVYTTGQIAKMCRVAPRTVAKWFDSGKLGGYKVPLSQDRRVPISDLRAFLADNGVPLPPELCATDLASYALDERLGVHFDCPLEFGAFCAMRTVHTAVVGDTNGGVAAIARFLRRCGVPRIILVLSEDAQLVHVERAIVTKRPCDVRMLCS